MSHLSRYIGKTVLLAILGALFVVVALDAVSTIIGESRRMEGDYHFVDVLLYVGMTLPSSVYDYLPFAGLIGALAGVGLLAEKSEIIVMRAAGVSLRRIVIYVLRPVLLVILGGVLIGEFWGPLWDQWADARRDYLMKGKSEQDSTGGLWTRENREFLHFNAVFPGGIVYGITRYRFAENNQVAETSFATRATFNATEKYWVEEDVSISSFAENRVNTSKLVTRRWETELTPQVLSFRALDAESLSMRSLWFYMGYLEQRGIDKGEYRLAFWEKVFQPLAVVGLVLIGISFVFGPLRQSTMGLRIFVGVTLGVLFRMGQDLLGPSSIVFGFPAILAVIAPVLFCVVVGSWLLKRAG